jgi:hypothetical protein
MRLTLFDFSSSSVIFSVPSASQWFNLFLSSRRSRHHIFPQPPPAAAMRDADEL